MTNGAQPEHRHVNVRTVSPEMSPSDSAFLADGHRRPTSSF
jgi:hypothetical protein